MSHSKELFERRVRVLSLTFFAGAGFSATHMGFNRVQPRPLLGSFWPTMCSGLRGHFKDWQLLSSPHSTLVSCHAPE